MVKKYLALSVLFLFCAAHAKADVASKAEQPKQEVKQPVKADAKVSQSTWKAVTVNAQEVIRDTVLDKEPVQKLVDKQQGFQKELKEMGDKIQEKEKDYKAKEQVWSVDTRKKKLEEIEEDRQKAQLKLERYNRELQEEEFKMRNEVFMQLRSYAKKLADKDGVFVFEEQGGVLLGAPTPANESKELTKLIKEELAKKEAAKKKAASKKDEKKSPAKTH